MQSSQRKTMLATSPSISFVLTGNAPSAYVFASKLYKRLITKLSLLSIKLFILERYSLNSFTLECMIYEYELSTNIRITASLLKCNIFKKKRIHLQIINFQINTSSNCQYCSLSFGKSFVFISWIYFSVALFICSNKFKYLLKKRGLNS